MTEINISISAEPIFYLGPIPITNSIFTSWIITFILILVSLWANQNVKYTKRPTGFQNFLELIVETFYNMVQGITESTIKTQMAFPFVISFFFFILLNNWFGLLPGVGTILVNEAHAPQATEVHSSLISQAHASEEEATTHETTTTTTSEVTTAEAVPENEHEAEKVPLFRAGTSDLNTTLALALVSCVATWFFGIKMLGVHYFDRFKNPLEIISEFSRIISFTFRLFGNIFAGEVLLIVMSALVPIIVPSAFYGLEVFVGVIQAYVFSILTLAFMNLAMSSHGDHNEAHA